MYFPVLDPQTVAATISQQAAMSEWLLNTFGCNAGGSVADHGPLFDPETDIAKGRNCIHLGHFRRGSFHVMNNSRKVAKGRAPGAPSAQSDLAEMGVVPFVYPRLADSIKLFAEDYANLGLIDNPAQRDETGQRMIGLQTKVKAQEAANWRKAALIGALRGSLFAQREGESWNYSFTSGEVVSSQLSAGNKNGLNMTGGGDILAASWGSASTNINEDLDQINEGFQRKCGGALRTVICGSDVWNAVIRNDFIRAGAGTSNPPFEMLTHQVPEKLASRAKNVKVARLNTHPQLTWYVTDEVVELADGIQKVVPTGKAIFLAFEPDDGTVAMYEGAELVAEYDGGPKTTRVGFHSYFVEKADPTATQVYFLDNAMPVIHVPEGVAFGDCIY